MGIVAHIVITGASSGLGAALARHYARQGASLTLFGRHLVRLSAVAESCRASGANVATHCCDVMDGPGMRERLLSVDASLAVDLVIANAGIGGGAVIAPQAGESPALARSILDTNTLGVLNTVSPLIERFMQRRQGQFVIVSSIMAYLGPPEAPVYSASKAAIRIYGHGLRRLLAPHGIAVTVVCPGFIDTPMSETLPFVAPFMISPEQASARIAKAVTQRRSEAVFPWQVRALAMVARMLPQRALDSILGVGKELTVSDRQAPAAGYCQTASATRDLIGERR